MSQQTPFTVLDVLTGRGSNKPEKNSSGYYEWQFQAWMTTLVINELQEIKALQQRGLLKKIFGIKP